VVQARWAPLVGTVTTKDAVYHTADEGSSIARASIVAIARTVTVTVAVAGATVIDRSITVAATVSGNTTATGEASPMSATMEASHCMAPHRMSDGMGTWMAGS